MAELEGVVKNIMNIASTKNQSQGTSKIHLPEGTLSLGELASVLNVLAQQYKTTLPSLLRKLDSVSGNLEHLDRYYTQNDQRVCWTPEEDDLLNQGKDALLIRWKGQDAVQLRREYLRWKGK